MNVDIIEPIGGGGVLGKLLIDFIFEEQNFVIKKHESYF